jgi:MFS transporter, DHA2 family, multidrug resistance protein
VWRQQTLRDPLVDLRLFRSPTFSASLAANTLSLANAFGIFLFIAQYLQLVLGFTPLEAGLWTVPSAAGFIAGSMLAPALVRAGVASGISETGAELGGALGIALLGSIGVAVYRSQIADAVPSAVPAETSETAEDTRGGATEAVESLPGELGETLLDAAREAFTQGMQVAALAGAAVATATPVLAAIFLRRVTQRSPEEEPATPAPEAAFEATSS